MTTDDTERIDLLASLWRHFAEHEAGPYSPLYAAIARSVAEDRALLGRVIDDTPPEVHMPLALMAAGHDLVLRWADHPLTAVYERAAVGEADADARVQFADFCEANWPEIVDLLQARRVQTNECGRSAAIALALAKVADLHGTPDALIDAGASAGLNLLYDRYHLDYGPLGSFGDPSSRVRVPCEVQTADHPLPASLPDIRQRVGLDRNPLDVRREDDRRWLLACVWPDTGRLQRTADALDIAAHHPPDVRPGDMVGDLAATIDQVDGGGLVCVLTSWAAGYLSGRQRETFAEVLDDAGRRRDVVWLSLEGAGVVRLFEQPRDPGTFEIAASVIGAVRFRRGTREGRPLGLVHPHGKSVAWLTP